MNLNDSVKEGETVINIPFWVVALVSAILVMAGYAIYHLLTSGN